MPWRDKVMEMINLAAYLAGTKPWQRLVNTPTTRPEPRGGLVIEIDVEPDTQRVWSLAAGVLPFFFPSAIGPQLSLVGRRYARRQ